MKCVVLISTSSVKRVVQEVSTDPALHRRHGINSGTSDFIEMPRGNKKVFTSI